MSQIQGYRDTCPLMCSVRRHDYRDSIRADIQTYIVLWLAGRLVSWEQCNANRKCRQKVSQWGQTPVSLSEVGKLLVS